MGNTMALTNGTDPLTVPDSFRSDDLPFYVKLIYTSFKAMITVCVV